MFEFTVAIMKKPPMHGVQWHPLEIGSQMVVIGARACELTLGCWELDDCIPFGVLHYHCSGTGPVNATW